MIDLNKYTIVYKENVYYNALGIIDLMLEESNGDIKKPKTIEIAVIDPYGKLILIRDDASEFQFLPKSPL